MFEPKSFYKKCKLYYGPKKEEEDQLDITTVCYFKDVKNKLASISVYGVHLEDALLSVMREVFKETGESRPVFALIQGEKK